MDELFQKHGRELPRPPVSKHKSAQYPAKAPRCKRISYEFVALSFSVGHDFHRSSVNGGFLPKPRAECRQSNM
jgi:hypothetical protein